MSRVSAKLKRIEQNLEAAELGLYHDMSLHQCADYVAWVAQYDKAPRTVWLPLCEKITRLFDEGAE